MCVDVHTQAQTQECMFRAQELLAPACLFELLSDCCCSPVLVPRVASLYIFWMLLV